jgi:hypothetical protein
LGGRWGLRRIRSREGWEELNRARQVGVGHRDTLHVLDTNESDRGARGLLEVMHSMHRFLHNGLDSGREGVERHCRMGARLT